MKRSYQRMSLGWWHYYHQTNFLTWYYLSWQHSLPLNLHHPDFHPLHPISQINLVRCLPNFEGCLLSGTSFSCACGLEGPIRAPQLDLQGRDISRQFSSKANWEISPRGKTSIESSIYYLLSLPF